ncbi:hypothetical protein M430DRAFT_193879 [Amorphotheca resinae ATCC 22711]|uniref:Post-SET domain-containing protein n=1 Tax=Amorphotheca resinae ATCC 22711 TaxID=857342 RepID=A0A2T3AQC4_AMORE|nr:hypothetical protein M430DRAFT_193879 [Amorphotheca resinae ATCC 22711]PSS07174.1 hypothetical protein M430DRAFT_193879 [Amorphotheca resinae ATCC 22711]
MAPLTPTWTQPSHPLIQEVLIGSSPTEEFSTKSISRVALPPDAVFAELSFPPCTKAERPTYATVQMGRDEHLDLNSDLLYINHSCEPSLIFDTTALQVRVGPRGLRPGDELTFFYPSTEWAMAQGFTCLCGAATCRGYIAGARDMTEQQLRGVWLNKHIREMIAERDGTKKWKGARREGLGSREMSGEMGGDTRRGVTSRELSGEMGGDTLV